MPTKAWIVAGICAALTSPLRADTPPGNRTRSLGGAALEEATARDDEGQRELVEAILVAREAAAGRALGAGLRGDLGQSLRALPVERLKAFLAAGGRGDIEAALRDAGITQALGDSAADLVFSPVPPCRIIDTRAPIVGALVAGTQRSFLVRNPTGFASQGGSATDCGIAAAATSVEMNFVAVGPSGAGDLRAFPYGGALPAASVLNYANVGGLNIANGIAQPVCNPAGATPCNQDFTVQADASTTHLVVDVVGYFSKVDKSAVKSFVVNSLKTGPITAIPAGTCASGGSIALTAPGPGRVIVRANVELQLNHTFGTYQEVYVTVGATATDCNSNFPGYGAYATVAGAEPTSAEYYPWTNPFAVYDVTAGPRTFYLNAQGAAGTATIMWVGMEATFIPN